MENFKVVTLGTSGAGKTLFLASLFKELSTQKNSGFKLVVEDIEKKKRLNGIYHQIITGDKWPKGTKNIAEWTFNCCVQTEELKNYTACQFTYYDYAGGRLIDNEDQPFEKLVKEADAILGLLDGRKIYACLTDEDQKLKNIFFNQDLPSILKRMQTSNVPLHFVISKWDILQQNNISLSQVKKLLLGVPEFEKLLEIRKEIGSPVRLIPISAVGLNFATLQPDGSMKKNLEVQAKPFLVAVPLACILPDRLQQLEKQKELEIQNQKRGFLTKSLDILSSGMGGVQSLLGNEFLKEKIVDNKELVESFSNASGMFKTQLDKISNQIKKKKEDSLKSVKDERSALVHAIKVFKDFEEDARERFPDSKLV